MADSDQNAPPGSAPAAASQQTTPVTGRTPAVAATPSAKPATGPNALIAGRPVTGPNAVIARPVTGQSAVIGGAKTPAPSTGGRRKLVLELLTECIEKSKVRDIVATDTIRFAVESTVGARWRGSEMDLEGLWKILSKEPGLDERSAALPLLVFSTFGANLNLTVKLPEVLEAFPMEMRIAMRDELRVGADQLAKAEARLAQVASDRRRIATRPTR
jgi:hypothetical protein